MRNSTLMISSLILLSSALTLSCSSFPLQKTCTVKTSKLNGENFQVSVTSYIPHNSDNKSLLLMPPTGGTSSVDRSYAKKFCNAGFDVYILNTWTGDDERGNELSLHQSLYAKGQKAINLVLAQVKTPFVGIMGTSVGALHASIAVATIERLNAGFFIAGGLPLMEITVKSDQQAMRELRTSRMARFGYPDDEAYLQALRENFKLEPMEQGSIYKSKKYGMVIAEADETVPTKTQIQLKDFLQPTKVISLNNSHLVAIVNTWLYHQTEVVDFFKEAAKP